MAAMRNSWDGWGWMVIDGDGDTLRFDSIHLISNKCHWIFFYLDADEKVEKYDEAEVKHLIEVSHQTL